MSSESIINWDAGMIPCYVTCYSYKTPRARGQSISHSKFGTERSTLSSPTELGFFTTSARSFACSHAIDYQTRPLFLLIKLFLEIWGLIRVIMPTSRMGKSCYQCRNRKVRCLGMFIYPQFVAEEVSIECLLDHSSNYVSRRACSMHSLYCTCCELKNLQLATHLSPSRNEMKPVHSAP